MLAASHNKSNDMPRHVTTSPTEEDTLGGGSTVSCVVKGCTCPGNVGLAGEAGQQEKWKPPLRGCQVGLRLEGEQPRFPRPEVHSSRWLLATARTENEAAWQVALHGGQILERNPKYRSFGFLTRTIPFQQLNG